MSLGPGAVGFSSPLLPAMYVSPTAVNAEEILMLTGRGSPARSWCFFPDPNPDEPLPIRLRRVGREGVVHGLFHIALEEEVARLSGARILGLEVANVQLPRALVVPILA